MNNRSGLLTFLFFVLLAAMITLQVLGMLQSDRLYARLNHITDQLSGQQITETPQQNKNQADKSSNLPMPVYPGDDGDWLIWCLDSEPATLNTIVESATWPTRHIVNDSIFETLTAYEPNDFKIRGILAEKFSVSPDGLEIYFKLRDDIKFSDGVPITTDDVIFTFKAITDPNVDAAGYANYFRDVDRYEKINDKEIKFYMKKVYFMSDKYLGGMLIYPKHIYGYRDAHEFNNRISNPVGSGPYVFEKWDVGNQVILNRNENYWGEKPKIRKRVYKFITNDTAALQALQAGQVDYMRPLPEQFAEKNNDSEFRKKFYCLSYWDAGNTGYFWIGWNQAKPFFADKKVRLALTYMIDREAIKKYILRNPDAEIPTGPFYIYGSQNDPNIKPWPYDQKKAAQLLDEADWIDHDNDGIRDKNGIPFRFKYMIVGGVTMHEQIAKLVKDSAAKLGIEVTPDPYEWSIFTQKVQNRDFDALNMAWGGSMESDPYQIWHSSQIEKGTNYVRFNNPEADSLIEQARQTLDTDKRNALYHRFHKIIHEEQPYTFIYTRPEQRFLNKNFKNVNIYKLGIDEREWYVPKEKQRYK